MDEEQLLMKRIREAHHPVIMDMLAIINDMALTATKKFRPERISLFRSLSLGYLLICKNNLEATLRLSEHDLVHQISYINRNMFEIALTLYYVGDNKDKIVERINRYFEYNDSVIRRKSIKTANKYPKFLDQVNQDIEKKVDLNYKKFIEKYSKLGKKCNVESWSGLTMNSMIDGLLNVEIKEHLLKHYEIIIKMFNNFLHPTKYSAEIAVEEFVKGETEHVIGLWQVKTTMGLAFLIMDKHLSLFQRDRPAFKNRINRAVETLNKIDAKLGRYYSASSVKPYRFTV